MTPAVRLMYLEALDRALYAEQSAIVVRRADLLVEMRTLRCSLSEADAAHYADLKANAFAAGRTA